MNQIRLTVILVGAVVILIMCPAAQAAITPDYGIKNDLIAVFDNPVAVHGYPYQDLLANAADKYNISLPYLLAVVRGESFFDSKAKSSKGAIGLMQVMPSTAADYGISESELYDPIKNIDAGVHYLADLYNQLNDPYLTLAAYYCGPGGVDKVTFTLRQDCNEYVHYIHRHLKKIIANSQPKAQKPSRQKGVRQEKRAEHFVLARFDNFLDATQFLNFISKQIPEIELDIFRKDIQLNDHERFQYQILSRADSTLTQKNICSLVEEKSGFSFCE